MEHFIETVRRYPCLWNTTAIEYRDQELKDAAWAEVMKGTDLSSVKEVKLKWKKLRDSYRDALKRQSEMLAKDPNIPGKKTYPWKYMQHMQFLQPYMMSNRKKRGESALRNGHAVDGSVVGGVVGGAGHGGGGERSDESESESEAESAPPPSKRRAGDRLGAIDRKLAFLCQQQGPDPTLPRVAAVAGAAPQPPDPLDIFFESMCQSTKRFSFQAQLKIKRTLFEAVFEAEEAALAEQQSYASLWARGANSSDASSEPEIKPS